MPKKILYISYDGLTDNLGQSQILPYVIELTKKGYEYTIISFEKTDKYQQGKDNIQQIVDANNINWQPIKYTSKPPVISTIKDVFKLIKTSKKLHKQHKFDIAHCRSYISAFGGLALKKQYGVKFIFDMRGFWADERIDGGLWSLKNPIFRSVYKYFKRQEIKYFNNADYTISLTHNGKDEIHTMPKIKNNPIQIKVIPCCADFSHFDKKNVNTEKLNSLKKELKISESDFILSYLGSIGTWYMLDEMLDFFKVLLHKKPNAKFLFITSDNKAHILEKARAKDIPTDKIIIHSALRNDVPTFISLSTVSIFFIKPLYSKKASSPTKLAELMGMGVPVICNSNVGDVDNIIKSTNAGLVIDEFNNQEYTKVVNNIDNLLKINKIDLRTKAQEMFSLQVGTERYCEVYARVLNDK